MLNIGKNSLYPGRIINETSSARHIPNGGAVYAPFNGRVIRTSDRTLQINGDEGRTMTIANVRSVREGSFGAGQTIAASRGQWPVVFTGFNPDSVELMSAPGELPVVGKLTKEEIAFLERKNDAAYRAIEELGSPFLGGAVVTSPPLTRRVYVNSAGKTVSSAHEGVDLVPAVAGDDTVYPITGGKVVLAKEMRGYGKTVGIRDAHGTTFYAHLRTINVAVGSDVGTRHPIGVMGNTGVGTGPHLHLERSKQNQISHTQNVRDTQDYVARMGWPMRSLRKGEVW